MSLIICHLQTNNTCPHIVRKHCDDQRNAFHFLHKLAQKRSHGVSEARTLDMHTEMQAHTHSYRKKITAKARFIRDLYTRSVCPSMLVYTEARVIL